MTSVEPSRNQAVVQYGCMKGAGEGYEWCHNRRATMTRHGSLYMRPKASRICMNMPLVLSSSFLSQRECTIMVRLAEVWNELKAGPQMVQKAEA